MGKVSQVSWLLVAISVNSVFCAPSLMKGVWSPEGCLVPVEDPTDKGRLIWGVIDIWTDEANPEFTTQSLCDSPCGCYYGTNIPLQGNQPDPNLPYGVRPGGNVHPSTSWSFPINPTETYGGVPNRPNQFGGYTGNTFVNNGYLPGLNMGGSGLNPNQPNQFGGYTGNPGQGLGQTRPNEFGGYNGNTLTPGYGTNIVNAPVSANPGYVNTANNYGSNQYNKEQTSFDQNKESGSNSYGNNVQVIGLTDPRPGYPVVSTGSNYGNSQFNKEQTSFDQNKESGSSSYGNNAQVVGLAGQRPAYPVVSTGSNYGNSQFNKEQTSFDQNKESGSNSYGSNVGVVSTRPGGIVPGVPSYLALGTNNYQNSEFNKEQTSFDQNKESGSNSYGSNVGVVGINGQRPGPYLGPSGVVSSTDNFGSSQFNKEQTSFDQNKESGSNSYGSNAQVIGVTGQRPVPYPGSVVSTGSNFGSSEFNKEQTSFDQNKESGSSSYGNNAQIVGLNRPGAYPGGVVSTGNNYGNSQFNKEQTSFDQNKESGSSSYGSNKVVDVTGQRPIPYIPGPSSVVSATNDFGASEYNKESTSFDQNKESGSSSFASNSDVVGLAGGRPTPLITKPIVSVAGNAFETSDYNKETVSFDQNKESGSSSFGGNNQVVGVTGQRPLIGGPSSVVSVTDDNFGSSEYNKESTSFDQNKESGSSSFGSNSAVVGVTGQRPLIGGPSSVVSVTGDNFGTSEYNKESTSFDQNKESGSSSFGSNSAVVGVTDPRPVPYIGGPSSVVSVTGDKYGSSEYNKESTSFDQNKESGSSSFANNGQVVALTGQLAPPLIAKPGAFVSASGDNYGSSEYNKESTSFDQNKESGSSSFGNSGQIVGVVGKRPGTVVLANENNVGATEFSKESTSFDQNKESGSSSFGSSGQIVGVVGQRPEPYIASPSTLVAASGNNFGATQYNKESTSFDQNKESGSSSFGSDVDLIASGSSPVPVVAYKSNCAKCGSRARPYALRGSK